MIDEVKLGEPVFGVVDGFGCVVEIDHDLDYPYLIHYATGKEELEDSNGIRILREQLKTELQYQEAKERLNNV